MSKIIARITPRAASHTIDYLDCQMCGTPIILTAHTFGQASRLQRQGLCHHHSAMRAAFRRDFRLRHREYARKSQILYKLGIKARAVKQPKGRGAE